MKTRVAIILIVVAVAAVVFVMFRFPGPERPISPPEPPPPPPEPVVEAATPVEAVVVYVEALYRKDYETAYGCLSAASKAAHPYEQFLERAEGGGATNFDLAAAEAGEEIGGRVLVTVPLVEDPASAGFTTVREEGNWRVVFIGGEPWFPYPEGESRGERGRVAG